jgi:hypothetical protein
MPERFSGTGYRSLGKQPRWQALSLMVGSFCSLGFNTKPIHQLPEFCTQISAMNTLLQFYIFAAAF